MKRTGQDPACGFTGRHQAKAEANSAVTSGSRRGGGCGTGCCDVWVGNGIYDGQ